MVKHATHLLHHASPLAAKTHKAARYPTRSPAHQNHPFTARQNARRSPARSRLSSANTNRFLSSHSQLATIREEPGNEEEEVQYDDTRELFGRLESWAHDDTQPGPSRRPGLDEDVDMLGWDEESTLVAMLQESGSEQDEEEQLIALVEQLKGPMAAQGSALRQYLKDTILPAYNSLRAANDLLEGKELEFGTGLLTFDEVCKNVERMALRDEDELKTARAESQRNIAQILQELEEAYDRRKNLWAALDQDIDRCATRATGALETLSADVEQVITALEKKSKTMDKEGVTSTNQKLLRGLLEKL